MGLEAGEEAGAAAAESEGSRARLPAHRPLPGRGGAGRCPGEAGSRHILGIESADPYTEANPEFFQTEASHPNWSERLSFLRGVR